MIQPFKRAKIVHTLDRAATVIGKGMCILRAFILKVYRIYKKQQHAQ
jgi:hypothetical protein